MKMKNLRELLPPEMPLTDGDADYAPPARPGEHRAVCKKAAMTDTTPAATYWCTLPVGHEGKHMAHGRKGDGYPVLAVWED